MLTYKYFCLHIFIFGAGSPITMYFSRWSQKMEKEQVNLLERFSRSEIPPLKYFSFWVQRKSQQKQNKRRHGVPT